MRTSKRALAGVAAGALTLALIPFVAATATTANAAEVTGTVSPVRVTTTVGTDRDDVPFATLSWTTSAALTNAETIDVTVTSAPPTGEVWIGTTAQANIGTTSVNTNKADFAGALTNFNPAFPAVDANSTAKIGIAASVAGSYTGQVKTYNAGVVVDTVNYSFQTTGVATGFSLSPASQTALVGQPAEINVSVTQANGQPTQLWDGNEVIALTASNGSLSVATFGAADAPTGSGPFTLTLAAAGTGTVTATPQGTFPSNGATTQTASVTSSGTISTLAVSAVSVTAPKVANLAGTNPAITADVPAGSTTVSLSITGNANAQAGDVVRLKGVANAGTPAEEFQNVTLDADKKGTATWTLGGGALIGGATFTVTQVDAAGGNIAGLSAVLTQQPRTYGANTIVPSPSGNNVAKFGDSVPVTVTVNDQFGDPLSGLTVRAYRTSVADANLITTATTNAAGVANVVVSAASSLAVNGSETYEFTAQAPTIIAQTTAATTLVVQYTETGGITSLTVTPTPASNPTAITDTTTSIVTAPFITVPADGVADTISTGTFTVATGAETAGNNGEVASFLAVANPGNAVTVTTSAGAFVSTDASTAWDEGQTSVTVPNSTTVYVFALQAGTHTVTFTSADKTVTVPVKAATLSANAYNIAITPAEQAIAPSGIGTVTLTVTDVFGNPVQGATTEGLTRIIASGEVLLPGFQTTADFLTGADGTALVTFIAGGAVGQGLLTATPATTATNAAWVANYTPPVNAPAPVTSAVAEIGVGQEPIEPAILIEGDRTNRRIQVDGVTFGLAASTEISPWIRFPGQVGFTQGVARPQITIVDTDEQIGEFVWGRNAGKRTVVEIRTADGLRSNRIIIPAR